MQEDQKMQELLGEAKQNPEEFSKLKNCLIIEEFSRNVQYRTSD